MKKGKKEKETRAISMRDDRERKNMANAELRNDRQPRRVFLMSKSLCKAWSSWVFGQETDILPTQTHYTTHMVVSSIEDQALRRSSPRRPSSDQALVEFLRTVVYLAVRLINLLNPDESDRLQGGDLNSTTTPSPHLATTNTVAEKTP